MTKLFITLLASVALLAACRARLVRPAVQPIARYATVAEVVDGVVYVAGGIERGAVGDTWSTR